MGAAALLRSGGNINLRQPAARELVRKSCSAGTKNCFSEPTSDRAQIAPRSVSLYARSGRINQETRKMMVRLGAAFGAAMFVVCSSLAMSATQPEKQNGWNAVASGPTIAGVASTYNPYRHDQQSGGPETASGELYDPNAWTAAIQVDLRKQFGGVHYGKDYRPAYALVVTSDKQAIVKINDVGPLEPGRVIDLNEQTMRYFDPSLKRGLIYRVEVTPLLGDDCAPGPVASG